MMVEAHPLITFLQEHCEERAMLAALRRGLGQPPGSIPDMFPYVVPFVGDDMRGWREETLYLIAALFGMHPESIATGNLGTHLRRLTEELGDAAATERRFQQLLSAEPEMLPNLLRQMVGLLRSKDIPINWQQLLVDVLQWDRPERRRKVALSWAREFWKSTSNQTK